LGFPRCLRRCKLGLADHLADGAKSTNELAQITRTHAPSLYRLMRTLCHQQFRAANIHSETMARPSFASTAARKPSAAVMRVT
jgi:hypothetical protein